MGWAAGDPRHGLRHRRRAQPQSSGVGPPGVRRDSTELAPGRRRTEKEEEEIRRSGLHHRQPQNLHLDTWHSRRLRCTRRFNHSHSQNRPTPPPQARPSR